MTFIRLLFFILICNITNAESLLTFEGAGREFIVPIDVELYKGRINVRTASGDPFSIDEIKASCGCTVPKFEKGVVSAGKDAAIDFEYAVKKKNGKDAVVLDISFTINKNGAYEKNTQAVRLVFASENTTSVSPKILTWDINSKNNDPKAVDVASERNITVDFDATSVPAGFLAQIEKQSPRAYRITVSRRSLVDVADGPVKHFVLPLTIHMADGKSYKDYIHFLLTK